MSGSDEAPADVASLGAKGGFEFVDRRAERSRRGPFGHGDFHQDDDLPRRLLQRQQVQHATEQGLAGRNLATVVAISGSALSPTSSPLISVPRNRATPTSTTPTRGCRWRPSGCHP